MTCSFCGSELQGDPSSQHLFVISFDLKTMICWPCIRAFDELCRQKLSRNMHNIIEQQDEILSRARSATPPKPDPSEPGVGAPKQNTDEF